MPPPAHSESNAQSSPPRPSLPLPTPQTLTPASLSSLLALYPHVLAYMPPQKRAPKVDVVALDRFRYEELPRILEERKKRKKKGGKDGDESQGWIELEELKKLMAWKLARGTYRATLPSLIASNAAPDVRSATASAFTSFAKTTTNTTTIAPSTAVLKPLLPVRGVGPATASLVLSVAFPDEVPFFGDELYAWLKSGESGGTDSPPVLPKLKMKYDGKEFVEVWKGVGAVKEERGVGSAAEVEKVAFVIGRLASVWEGVPWSEKEDGKAEEKVEGGGEGQEHERQAEIEEAGEDAHAAKGAKRKSAADARDTKTDTVRKKRTRRV